MEKADILSRTSAEIAEDLAVMGEPAYRAKQIFRWLHQKQAADFAAMSDLSKPLREKLTAAFLLPSLELSDRLQSEDGSIKYLFRLPDGNRIESVAMFYRHGMSVCVSTQVGCAMGCRFCASAVGGLVRNLSAAEMLLQVYAVSRDTGHRADSIVMMGIGEPLDNFCNVVRFYDMITDTDGFALANRKVSLSTCGLCEGIDRLAGMRKQLTLSVSLHAADDESRTAIMPVNRRYGVARLMESCRNYQKKTGRRISFEYAVFAGVNDSGRDAVKLAGLVAGMGAHVNLIPANAAREGFSHEAGDVSVFRKTLAEFGVNATVRRALGRDIRAACGQLRRTSEDVG